MRSAEEVGSTCPVCLSPIGDEGSCRTCAWTLRTEHILGEATVAEQVVFVDRMQAAQRRFDLRAAARGAGFPSHGDEELLGRLLGFIRGGPPTAEEVSAARRARSPVVIAETGVGVNRPPRPGLAVEIGAAGVSVTRFEQDGGDVYELAEVDHRAWADLLPMLPTDGYELRFVLAGGIGRREASVAAAQVLPGALHEVTEGTPPFLLVCTVPGWPLAEQALAAWRERYPDARVEYCTADAGPKVLRTQSRITTFACVSDDGGGLVVATGSADGTVQIQSSSSEESVEQVLHEGRVTALDLAQDGSVVISGGQDGAVRMWPLARGGRGRVLASHRSWVNAVRIAGGAVFSLGDDAQLRRSWPNSNDGATELPVNVGFSASTALAVSADAQAVVIGGTDGRLQLLTREGARRGGFPVGAAITALAMEANGELLTVMTDDGSTRVYRLPEQSLVGDVVPVPGAQVSCIAAGANGEVAVGDDSGWVRVWRPEHPAETTVIGRHRDSVVGISVTGSGLVVSAGRNGLVRSWRGVW